MTTEFQLTSLLDTKALAEQMVSKLPTVRIFALNGPIGAGKTTFSKAFAAALGITDTVVSPTYTLLQPYTLPTPINGITELVHIDAYRLENADELRAIGFEDFVNNPQTALLIEWAENVADILKKEKVIRINFDVSKDGRVCRVTI